MRRGERDAGAERLAGHGRMLGRDQVGVGRARPRPREGQHPRSESSQHPHLRGHRRFRRVQRVQVLRHLRVRAGVGHAQDAFHQRRMAVPQPEQEPRAEPCRQARAPARHLRRVVHPYIQHSGRERHPPGRGQQMLDRAQHVAPGVRDEDGPVPEVLQLGRRGGPRARVRVIPELAAPDPYSAQVNGHIRSSSAVSFWGWAAAGRRRHETRS